MAGGVVNQPALIDLPRPARQVRQSGGVDVTVGDGGTGVSTLTDGGVVVGSGSSPVTVLSRLTNNQMMVGQSAGDPVNESGDTLRISIGVGSTSTPQLTGIELGAAADTTLTRASAGNMAIEGNLVQHAGTDVPVTDGGTGGSTVAAALTNLGVANHDSIAISSDGEAINTEQPAFLANNSATDTNVTGDGATPTVDYDNEIFDQNADFASDTFTAPVTGRYLLSAAVRFITMTAGTPTQALMQIVTGNRTYRNIFLGQHINADGNLSVTVIADMDESDTATVTVRVQGEASDLADIEGSSTFDTYFSGCLIT